MGFQNPPVFGGLLPPPVLPLTNNGVLWNNAGVLAAGPLLTDDIGNVQIQGNLKGRNSQSNLFMDQGTGLAIWTTIGGVAGAGVTFDYATDGVLKLRNRLNNAAGAFTASTLTLGGATIGPNALAVTGGAAISGTLTAGTLVATGSVSTVDGRVQQASGPIMDMRTANTFQFFQSDNVTKAAIQAGSGTFSTTLATAAPAGSSAGLWKLGALQTAAVVLDTTRSIFVDIGGAVYKLMVAQ